ncbi:MAG: hypothetical protein DMF19_05900 [Verrucomicrobia bacterium]|nr:MAG: hypothetical protein DMF19_05900 [Verrucomicrobiota bacterium]
MTTTPICVFSILTLLSPLAASAAGLPPWKFGMTKAEVTSFKEFGPYKEFSNGDLETFNGRFHGRKENIHSFSTVADCVVLEFISAKGQIQRRRSRHFNGRTSYFSKTTVRSKCQK